ncbi:zinc finger, CCHC-type containing protein, partial [Tanacetum coccineum]
MRILSVLLEITPNLAMKATRIASSSPQETTWYLFDPRPSGWYKMDAHSTDFASNWLERLPVGSITTWEDLTTRILAQFFPPGRTVKLRNDILMFQQHHGESLSEAWTHFKDLLQKVPHHGIDLWLQVQIFYDHVNPVTRRTIDQSAGEVPYDNRITLPHVRSAVGPTTLNIAWKILNKPLLNMYPRVPTKREAITDRIAGTLSSDTIKNPKLSTSLVLSGRSYPTKDPQCSTHVHGLINAVTMHPKQQSDSQDDRTEENEEEEKDNLENIHVNPSAPPDPSVAFITEKVLKLNSFFESLGLVPQSSNTELVCTKGDDGASEESVYESLIKEMPKCSLNYDFKIKKGDPRNLKIPCMI